MDYNKEIVGPGDRFSALAREVCIASRKNSAAVIVGSGGEGMRAMDSFTWTPNVLQAMLDGNVQMAPQSDGAGGKPQFFALQNEADDFYNLGWEIITMNADDGACRGGFPALMLSSNIDTKQITNSNWHLCEALLEGFKDALAQSNLVLMTGETAIMKDSITAFCDYQDESQLILTWGGTCLSLTSKKIWPNGSTIKPGMSIVGLRDKGYRCNGGSKFTDILRSVWGDNPMNTSEGKAFVKRLVVPSRSYARTISRLNGWQDDGTHEDPIIRLHGVAHVTGGGIWSKLGEILPPGVGANLHSMPEPATVILKGQQLSMKTSKPMSDYECHGTFHGGCGVFMICHPSRKEQLLEESANDGHDPHYVGETTSSEENEIVISSRFSSGGQLSSLNPN